jgi:DNA-binding transcriptional ArsR family regulator
MPDSQTSHDPASLNAVFQALSDDRRRAMIDRLSTGALSVSDLAGPMGLRLPAAVKHLAVLEESGLVMSEKVGRVRTFRLRPKAFDLINQWLAQREAALTAAFNRLDQAIADFPETNE